MTNVIKSCLNIDELLALKMKEITEFQEDEGTSNERVGDIDERLNYRKNADEREAAANLEYKTESLMEEIDQEMETTDEEVATLRQDSEQIASQLEAPFEILLNDKDIEEVLKYNQEELIEVIEAYNLLEPYMGKIWKTSLMMDAIRAIAKEAIGREFKKQLENKVNQEMVLEGMRKKEVK